MTIYDQVLGDIRDANMTATIFFVSLVCVYMQGGGGAGGIGRSKDIRLVPRIITPTG